MRGRRVTLLSVQILPWQNPADRRRLDPLLPFTFIARESCGRAFPYSRTGIKECLTGTGALLPCKNLVAVGLRRCATPLGQVGSASPMATIRIKLGSSGEKFPHLPRRRFIHRSFGHCLRKPHSERSIRQLDTTPHLFHRRGFSLLYARHNRAGRHIPMHGHRPGNRKLQLRGQMVRKRRHHHHERPVHRSLVGRNRRHHRKQYPESGQVWLSLIESTGADGSFLDSQLGICCLQSHFSGSQREIPMHGYRPGNRKLQLRGQMVRKRRYHHHEWPVHRSGIRRNRRHHRKQYSESGQVGLSLIESAGADGSFLHGQLGICCLQSDFSGSQREIPMHGHRPGNRKLQLRGQMVRKRRYHHHERPVHRSGIRRNRHHHRK